MSAPAQVVVRYQITTALAEAEIDRAGERLSADERARASRFRHPDARRDYVAAHALLRAELSRQGDAEPGDWRFLSDSRGRPALLDRHPAAPTSFSLSHGRGIVACALAPGLDVGVDVECLAHDVSEMDVARRFFSRAELAHLERAGASRRARFFEFWTLKEAYAKAAGVGLMRVLEQAAFEIDGNGVVRCTSASDASDWHFMLSAPAPSYRLAVAVRRRGLGVSFEMTPAGGL